MMYDRPPIICSHSAFVGFCRGTSDITDSPTLDRGVSFDLRFTVGCCAPAMSVKKLTASRSTDENRLSERVWLNHIRSRGVFVAIGACLQRTRTGASQCNG